MDRLSKSSSLPASYQHYIKKNITYFLIWLENRAISNQKVVTNFYKSEIGNLTIREKFRFFSKFLTISPSIFARQVK